MSDRIDAVKKLTNVYKMVEIKKKTNVFSQPGFVECYHNDGGPAVMAYKSYTENKEAKVYLYEEIWCRDGKEHRVGGPAYIRYKKDGIIDVEEYYVDGKLHREKGPAIIEYAFDDGAVYTEWYYQDGEAHRDNGPARITYYGNGDLCYQEFYTRGIANKTKNTFMTENKLNDIKYEEWPSEMISLLWLSA